MNIGNIEIKGYAALAPMAGVADRAMREICKEHGSAFSVGELTSSKGISVGDKKSHTLLFCGDKERPMAYQLFGREPETMAEAAKKALEFSPDFIDINMGCPAPKVSGNGGGSALLKNLPLAEKIVKAVVDAVNIPVTVKTRLGWDENSKCIVDLAEQLQDCGIAALTVHGRTRAQMYTGDADWTLIGKIKENPRMHIPIIGNGDVKTPERAKECFDKYGVDAVMIGRASFGQPWIFRDVKHYLEHGEPAVPFTFTECMDILREQVKDSVEWLGERPGILHVRRHLAATPLLKGLTDFRPLRIEMLRAEKVDELMAILDRIVEIYG